jgi:archaellum component FlaF (FlaF/FlaG flagellin family)
VSPREINFGSVRVGSSSSTRIVTVSNDGTADLYISGITVDNGQFVITSKNITQTLAPGASAQIILVFKPTSTGGKSATMAIISDDPDERTVDVKLSGTGTTPPGPGPGPNPPITEPITEINYFTVDFLGKITTEVATSDGRPIKRMEAPSPDGTHLLEIEADTQATDNTTGDIITLLEIREAETPELPENTKLIGKAYEFKPSGTVFDRPVRLTLGYNVNELPDRVTSVGVAYYTAEGGWTYLETEATNVAELGKLTTPVNHFTVFAVLATVAPAPPPPEPTPKWTPEPQPQPQPGPKPTAPAEFTLSNLSIATTVSRIFKNFAYIVRTGEEAVITIDVTNQGGQSGSYAISLIINGAERERTEITLEPGQTQTVSFTATNNEPGNYSVAIGDLTGNYLSKIWINWWLIGSSAGVLILIAWGVWYYFKKRQPQI